MHTCMYIHTHTQAYTQTQKHMHTHSHKHVGVCVCVGVCLSVCVCIGDISEDKIATYFFFVQVFLWHFFSEDKAETCMCYLQIKHI